MCARVVLRSPVRCSRIAVRATNRVIPLSQCGIAPANRFAFYDQIHTTGIDLKLCNDACSALTLGKDMIFRDYAQGAFRCRGIGQGQTVSVVVIPECAELMARQLGKASFLEDASAPPRWQTDVRARLRRQPKGDTTRACQKPSGGPDLVTGLPTPPSQAARAAERS